MRIRSISREHISIYVTVMYSMEESVKIVTDIGVRHSVYECDDRN